MPEYRILRMGKDENGADRIGAVSQKRGLLAELRLSYETDAVSLSYLWVKERERRKGVGTYLLQSVLDIVALRDGFTPVECSFVQDGTVPLEYFFEAQPNFNVDREAHIYHLDPEVRKKSVLWNKLIKHGGAADYFFEQDTTTRSLFYKKIEKEGFASFVDNDKKLYEEPLCFAHVSGGEIKAAVLFKKHPDNELELAFAYADSDSKIRLPKLLGAAAETIEHDYPDHEMFFTTVNPQSQALADHLMEDENSSLIRKETVCRACWLGWSKKEVLDIYRVAGNIA